MAQKMAHFRAFAGAAGRPDFDTVIAKVLVIAARRKVFVTTRVV